MYIVPVSTCLHADKDLKSMNIYINVMIFFFLLELYWKQN